MNINNVELEADFLDADFMERYEVSAAEMQKRANAAKERKWARSSDAMKEICAYINEFFDAVFGAGTAEKIFGGKNNVGEHFDAFEAIVAERSRVDARMNNTRTRGTATCRCSRDSRTGSSGGTRKNEHPDRPAPEGTGDLREVLPDRFGLPDVDPDHGADRGP